MQELPRGDGDIIACTHRGYVVKNMSLAPTPHGVWYQCKKCGEPRAVCNLLSVSDTWACNLDCKHTNFSTKTLMLLGKSTAIDYDICRTCLSVLQTRTRGVLAD